MPPWSKLKPGLAHLPIVWHDRDAGPGGGVPARPMQYSVDPTRVCACTRIHFPGATNCPGRVYGGHPQASWHPTQPIWPPIMHYAILRAILGPYQTFGPIKAMWP